jgi:hypothetical protein
LTPFSGIPGILGSRPTSWYQPCIDGVFIPRTMTSDAAIRSQVLRDLDDGALPGRGGSALATQAPICAATIRLTR